MPIPVPDEPISPRFSLSHEEFVLAHIELQSTPAGRKARTLYRKWAVFFALGALACAALWILGMRRPEWKLTFDAYFLLSLIAGWFAFIFLKMTLDRTTRRTAERTAHSPLFEDLFHEHAVTLNPEGFTLDGVNTRVFNRWRLFESATLTPNFLALAMADRRVHLVPRRVLSDAEVTAHACTHWIAADGGGEQRSVVAYLKTHDTPCPKCKYQLRGLGRAQCPECGTVLGRENLPAAFA